MNKEIENALILYAYIYDRLYEVAGKRGVVTIAQSKKIVAHSFNIPYNLWYLILKVMEDFGWLQKENKHIIRLIQKPKHIGENIGQYMVRFGLSG